MLKLTTQEFINRARAVHGDKYGYAFSVYQSNKVKLTIYCPEHGLFKKRPCDHIIGQGCSGCSGKKIPTTQEFIRKARKVHGDTYLYENTIYYKSYEKVSIICKKHGEFQQTPDNHLSGSGCPGCTKTGFDRTKVGFLYILRSDCGQYMKIGVTNYPKQRHSQLFRSTPFSFKRIELIEGQGDQIANLEKELLAEYQPAGFTETFDGSTEWRLFNDSIRNKVKKDLRP